MYCAHRSTIGTCKCRSIHHKCAPTREAWTQSNRSIPPEAALPKELARTSDRRHLPSRWPKDFPSPQEAAAIHRYRRRPARRVGSLDDRVQQKLGIRSVLFAVFIRFGGAASNELSAERLHVSGIG